MHSSWFWRGRPIRVCTSGTGIGRRPIDSPKGLWCYLLRCVGQGVYPSRYHLKPQREGKMSVVSLYDLDPMTFVNGHVAHVDESDLEQESVSVNAFMQFVHENSGCVFDFGVFSLIDSEKDRKQVLKEMDDQEEAAERMLAQVSEFVEDLRAAFAFARMQVTAASGSPT